MAEHLIDGHVYAIALKQSRFEMFLSYFLNAQGPIFKDSQDIRTPINMVLHQLLHTRLDVYELPFALKK